jgi:hypothetical protein
LELREIGPYKSPELDHIEEALEREMDTNILVVGAGILFNKGSLAEGMKICQPCWLPNQRDIYGTKKIPGGPIRSLVFFKVEGDDETNLEFVSLPNTVPPYPSSVLSVGWTAMRTHMMNVVGTSLMKHEGDFVFINDTNAMLMKVPPRDPNIAKLKDQVYLILELSVYKEAEPMECLTSLHLPLGFEPLEGATGILIFAPSEAHLDLLKQATPQTQSTPKENLVEKMASHSKAARRK